MIVNNNLSSEYGSADSLLNQSSVIAYKPTLSESDYNLGLVVRYFAVRTNDSRIIEVRPDTRSSPLYQVVSLTWKISGPRVSVFENGIKQRVGVVECNTSEIDRVRTETGVDLSKTLINRLEFWRGF